MSSRLALPARLLASTLSWPVTRPPASEFTLRKTRIQDFVRTALAAIVSDDCFLAVTADRWAIGLATRASRASLASDDCSGVIAIALPESTVLAIA